MECILNHVQYVLGQGSVPLGSPGHGIVEGDERRREVEHLFAKSAPGVEDGVVGSAGERILPVLAYAVCDDASLLLATCVSNSSVSSCKTYATGSSQDLASRSLRHALVIGHIHILV